MTNPHKIKYDTILKTGLSITTCGILAVYINNNENADQWVNKFQQLISMMAHRGPDAEKVENYEKVVFAHRRLSILDLTESGIQPMVSSDGRFFIIYNGEIYNYIEIRKELKAIGEEFHTETDTEVLLAAFRVFGDEFFSKLNGMFTFIIWDKEKEELLIARDRFGIKPLYYAYVNDNLVFSSEMKPILALKNELSPNHGIIYDYLVFTTTDHTDDTFFKGIFRFPAGHYAKVSKNGFHIKKYWDTRQEVETLRNDPDFNHRSLEQHIEMIQKIFTNSVRIRLRSDVTVGSCLSGGIDSSSIVLTVNHLLSDDSRDSFQTFSSVYGEWFDKSEKKYVDIVTQATGFKSNFITPDIHKLNELFDIFLWHQEEPLRGLSPFSQYCVMSLANESKAIVLLDGQGGDEILAGYMYLNGYYLYELLRKIKLRKLMIEMRSGRHNRSALKAFISLLLPTFIQRLFSSRKRHFQKFLEKKYLGSHSKRRIPNPLAGCKTLNETLINLLTHNFQHLLRFEDRNAMAFSIETRVPFLDHNLVIYVLALPSEFKIDKTITKWIFRKAMIDIVPDKILARTDKIGFAAPEIQWLKNNNFNLINKLTEELHPKIMEIVSQEKIKYLINKRNSGSINSNEIMFLFRVACLNKWFNLFFDSSNSAKEQIILR